MVSKEIETLGLGQGHKGYEMMISMLHISCNKNKQKRNIKGRNTHIRQGD